MKQLEQFKHIHLVGIGGAGMSAIAWILIQRGFKVSGSDLSTSAMTQKLSELGVRIHRSHHADNIEGADLVVTSTAIPPENPERQAAERDGIPIWRRAKALAAIMGAGRSIAVSGTHGKTTTTTMLGQMLAKADFDPTALVGGHVNDFGGNARLGHGEWIVAEADESDASFLEFHPDRIIITNIEADHLDFYSGLDEIIETFKQFVENRTDSGKIIACLDDPGVLRLLAENPDWPVLGYGLMSEKAEMRAETIEPVDGGRGTAFTPIWQGEPLPRVTLKVPGRHNVLNALAALACGLDIGAEFEPMAEALGSCVGAKRRFQIKGCLDGITVVDDYAHHPTEISATLKAAREQIDGGCHRRVIAIFQPHRYSRTFHLAPDFGLSLQSADIAIVTGIYAASEQPMEGVTGKIVADRVRAGGHPNVHYFEKLDDARDWVRQQLREGDLVMTLGAGNVWRVGEELVSALEAAHR